MKRTFKKTKIKNLKTSLEKIKPKIKIYSLSYILRQNLQRKAKHLLCAEFVYQKSMDLKIHYFHHASVKGL